MYIILVYDIKTDESGKRILNKVHKTCKMYLNHIQNSVFEGELSKSQLMVLKNKLDMLIRKEVDSVIIFKSTDEKWLKKEMMGIIEDKTSNFI